MTLSTWKAEKIFGPLEVGIDETGFIWQQLKKNTFGTFC